MRYLKYLAVFLLGFLLAKLYYDRQELKHQKEDVKVMLNSVANLSKLVVSEGSYSEIYSFSDTKNYFYNTLQFEKKAILSVNANVEVGYDLSKLEIQIDSVQKEIIINTIPQPDLKITPDIKYFDLQQSQFNSFSKDELNTLNEKAIIKIKETVEVSKIKVQAQERLFEELSKLYQLSKIYNWKVIDNTNTIQLNERRVKL